MFHSAGLYLHQEVQHQNPGHIPFPDRILMGTSMKQLGRGEGQAVPCPPVAASSSWQDTWLSASPLASALEICAAPTKAETLKARAEPCSEVVKHPTVSNYAILAKQDEKVTRADPILLGCSCTTPLM